MKCSRPCLRTLRLASIDAGPAPRLACCFVRWTWGLIEAVPDLARRLWAVVAEGRAAWPDISVEPKALVAFIARQLEPGQDPAEVLDGLRPGDLYLACGCSLGDATAIAAFDRQFMREV